MTNPLLNSTELPQFSQIKAEHIEPAIEQLLTEAQALVETLLSENEVYTWENLISPLEEVEDCINKAWSPVSHMNSTVNSDDLRDAYNACLPKLSAYSTAMGQHKGLFKAYEQIAASDSYATLEPAQQKIIQNSLRGFRLSGIDLDDEKQARYKEISLELSQYPVSMKKIYLMQRMTGRNSLAKKQI